MESLTLAKNIIEKSRNVFILPSPEPQGDSLGAALALFYTLKKLGKNANIDLGGVPEKFGFLTRDFASGANDFVISVNTEDKDVSQMRYEKNGKDLKIYLSLNRGQVSGSDISLVSAQAVTDCPDGTDLLISLGIQSLEDIPQNFWEVPILNIDNQPRNENFGEVNLVEMTSSLSETASGLIQLLGDGLLDGKTATCLLTGIIWSSQNFRNPRTKPKTFKASAFLIERGANHQEIVQCLYKQKNLAQIKLLGKVLEKLNFHEAKDVYSAAIKENDFKECRASSKDLVFVLEELKFHFRHFPNLLILWESHASPPITKGVFCSSNFGLSEKIMENFEGAARGNKIMFLVRETDLNIAEQNVLNIL